MLHLGVIRPDFIPSVFPLACVFVTALGLALSNELDVTEAIHRRFGSSHLAVILTALPGRIAFLSLLLMACCGLGWFTGSPLAKMLGITLFSCVVGFVINLPLLLWTVLHAQRSVRELIGAAESALHTGEVRAVAEVESGEPDRRTWGACVRHAENDQEIASYHYIRRRQFVIAKEILLEGGPWARWIPTTRIPFGKLYPRDRPPAAIGSPIFDPDPVRPEAPAVASPTAEPPAQLQP